MGCIADKTGGGGERLRRVGFGAKNGDCSARAAVTYAKYAPLHALAKPHFYHPNPTASDSKLESTFLSSLRALAQDKAWQSNSAQAESNQINGRALARYFESVVGGLGGQRGDKGGDFAIQAPPSPLERTLSQTKLESSHTAQKVESSFKKADSMDCRDLPSKSRNDRKPSPHILESKRHKLHTSTYSLHTILESQDPLKSSTTLESTFSMDSACGLESRIASSHGVDRPLVLSSLRDSQSPDSSSTILESIFEKTQMDCHADFQSARNDKNNAQSLSALQAAVKSSKTQTRILVQNDSKISKETCFGFALHRCRWFCGGAVVALRLLGKVSDLGDRAFHKRRNTAALLAQRQNHY
ncbi:hypothetical protein [Helicobacter canis]|uniref:Uncharacterized protein n=1 Tax=Helicobacter canis NCTC 12740 TaxID=1357399 RepID=V8CF33_9HELI|nr:hypothetical protein [Helicobacter canis]ETD25717.1 hypothetical protein HMPREF2087_01548 [Helicobacter canis NCTC 12740]